MDNPLFAAVPANRHHAIGANDIPALYTATVKREYNYTLMRSFYKNTIYNIIFFNCN
jgi:hypothetical protein